jgi:L-amino acid N-acyltransferase YncA
VAGGCHGLRDKELREIRGNNLVHKKALTVGESKTDAGTIKLAPMTPDDWEAVREIYREGMATGNATFEKAEPSWEKWDAGHLPSCRWVAWAGDLVLGWAALSPVSARVVYAGVAEVSVYVAAQARGHGVGSTLLSALVAASEENGIWTLQASIFPENGSSIAIHRKCGFRVVGTREAIGFMDGRWRDTVLMERRSSVGGR